MSDSNFPSLYQKIEFLQKDAFHACLGAKAFKDVSICEQHIQTSKESDACSVHKVYFCLNKIFKDMQWVALGAVSASFAQQMNQTQSYEARFGFNGTKYKSILHCYWCILQHKT